MKIVKTKRQTKKTIRYFVSRKEINVMLANVIECVSKINVSEISPNDMDDKLAEISDLLDCISLDLTDSYKL